MSCKSSLFRLGSVAFTLLLLVPLLTPLHAQQQDEGGGGAAPTSCPLIAGSGCPPVGMAKTGDINGPGTDDDMDGMTDEADEQDWKLKMFMDDKGNKIEIWCIDGNVPWYALLVTPAGGGAPRFVGKCPFKRGCNSKWKFDDTDADGNGTPDCFTKTVWISRDQQYGDQDDDGDGNVDWYKYTYDFAQDVIWTECWQSPDGEGDADGDGIDQPDELVDECHGKPPTGNFDFADLKPEDPTTPNTPRPTTPEEEEVPDENTPTEPTDGPSGPFTGAMEEVVDRVRLTGAAVGGTVGIELLGRLVEVETQPGERVESVIARLADKLRAHPKLGTTFPVAVEGAELLVTGAGTGQLVVHCTDPGIPVPSPVQNLKGHFDPVTAQVHLSWDLPPGADFDRLHIFRDGVGYRLNRLADTTSFVDTLHLDIETDAIHEYRIVSEKDGVRTATSVAVPVLFVREGEFPLPEPRVLDPR